MTAPSLIAIIMGSKSDWETMEHAAKTLDELKISYEVKIVSAHRTPDLLFQFAESAHGRGIEFNIAQRRHKMYWTILIRGITRRHDNDWHFGRRSIGTHAGAGGISVGTAVPLP